MSLLDLFVLPSVSPTGAKLVRGVDMAAPVEDEPTYRLTKPQPKKAINAHELRRRERIITRVAKMKAEIARLEKEMKAW